jgi:hypothetical protein
MSEVQSPKKRRFWQLHLSTVVILLLVVCAFLVFSKRYVEYAEQYFNFSVGAEQPMANEPTNYVGPPMGILYVSLFAMGISILALATLACEWLTRRREDRKP